MRLSLKEDSDFLRRYRLGRRVGQGGMGEVYLAEDCLLDREVAIKFESTPLEKALSDSCSDDLMEEARRLARHRHPNLPAVYDVGRESGYTFLVMEFIRGQTVSEMLQGGPPSLAEGLRIGRDLAGALAAMFLPGVLLLSGILPLWRVLSRYAAAARAIAGVNAAVVGLLGAALYDPVWTSAVIQPAHVAIALIGFTMISAYRLSVIYVVAWCVLANIVHTLLL